MTWRTYLSRQIRAALDESGTGTADCCAGDTLAISRELIFFIQFTSLTILYSTRYSNVYLLLSINHTTVGAAWVVGSACASEPPAEGAVEEVSWRCDLC